MNIATLRFTPADQQAFARLSGDFNPIHLDPVAARLVAAGAPIVHGVNLLLRALDAHFKDRVHAGRPVVTATFRRPALPGDSIAVIRSGTHRLLLSVDGAEPLVEIGIETDRRELGPRPGECAGGMSKVATRRATGPRVRAWSPLPRRSTLITSAPMSAMSLAAYGAETISPSSIILRSANAPAM